MTHLEITADVVTATATPLRERRSIGEQLQPASRLARRAARFARSVVAWGDQQPPHAQVANGGFPY